MCLDKCTFYSSSLLFHRFSLSHNMTKPTIWVCAQQRLRSAWASAQSDQSSLSAWRKLGSLATHWAHSEDSDQTGQMPRLIWVFTLRTHFVGFVMLWLFYESWPCLCRFHIFRSSLQISDLTASDSGEYACKAENDHGFIWGNTTLTVINDEGKWLRSRACHALMIFTTTCCKFKIYSPRHVERMSRRQLLYVVWSWRHVGIGFLLSWF